MLIGLHIQKGHNKKMELTTKAELIFHKFKYFVFSTRYKSILKTFAPRIFRSLSSANALFASSNPNP